MTVPSQVGSLTNIKSSAGSGSQSITVPTGATLALVLTSFWHTSVPDFTTLSLNGSSFSKAVKSASNSYELTNIWYLKSPTTGTFSWAISTTEGATITVMFLKDTDATTPIRGSNYGESNGDPVTGSFSSSTNDFIVGVGCGYGATSADAGVSGQTEIYDGGTYNSAYSLIGTKPGVSGTTTFTVDFSGSGMANSVCVVSIAGTSGLSATANQTTETDTAQALSISKVKAVGLNSETDTSQTLTRVKSSVIGLNAETDTAQAFSHAKVKAIGQASETDETQALSRSKVVAIGQTSETDAAQALTCSKVKAIGQNGETDEAQAFSRVKIKAIGQASETDEAQAFSSSSSKVIATGQASETDEAQALTVSKVKAVGQASETDTAQAMTSSSSKIVAIAQAVETDAAQAFTPRKVVVIQPVSETDLAQALFPQKRVAILQVIETDAAQALTGSKVKTIGQAGETDTALAFVYSVPSTMGDVTVSDAAAFLVVLSDASRSTLYDLALDDVRVNAVALVNAHVNSVEVEDA